MLLNGANWDLSVFVYWDPVRDWNGKPFSFGNNVECSILCRVGCFDVSCLMFSLENILPIVESWSWKARESLDVFSLQVHLDVDSSLLRSFVWIISKIFFPIFFCFLRLVFVILDFIFRTDKSEGRTDDASIHLILSRSLKRWYLYLDVHLTSLFFIVR